MVSIEPSFNMLNRHLNNDQEDFTLYPEPPQGVFSSAPMDVRMTPESFAAAFPTSMAYDPHSLYTEAPGYGGGFSSAGRSSPGTSFPDDAELRAPSSNLSTASAASSAVGSPQSNHGQLAPIPEWAAAQGLGVSPGIVGQNDYFPTGTEYSTFAPGMEDFAAQPPFDFHNSSKAPGFVDPSLIHPDISRPVSIGYDNNQFPNNHHALGSPPLSHHGGSSPQPLMRAGSQSPFLHNNGYPPFSPYPQPPMDPMRRQSVTASAFVSPGTFSESTPYSGDETSKEKQRCPHPDCGKTFKDLKAHMLTHQNERPEKCPIQTCDYHVKGFARKYDKNRHTLTHYKGTMVCGFCPGSGSAAEKSFNRADVFKRHLTAVHGVEQTPPNSRKKASGSGVAPGKKLAGYPPDATGKCSTCTQTFSNAQDFYEHLDDCVLRIVQQEDPAEAVNAQRLAEVENDRDVLHTLEKNNLPLGGTDGATTTTTEEEDEDEEMGEDDGGDGEDSGKDLDSPTRKKMAANGINGGGVQKSRGMTHSRGGVTLNVKKGRKNRRDYPSSWGFDKGQMTMKKRVLAVFDGQRRLAKDDMMLSTDHEVRIRLSDNKAYVTDLDVQTLKRAEGFHGATDEEKGPWLNDDPTEDDLKQMREMLEAEKAAETPA